VIEAPGTIADPTSFGSQIDSRVISSAARNLRSLTFFGMTNQCLVHGTQPRGDVLNVTWVKNPPILALPPRAFVACVPALC
jgi:hypothetical protein